MRGSIITVALPAILFPALAAPVPPQDDRAKLAQTYGVWADPDKDCTFKLTGGELKVSLPASHHLLGRVYGKSTDNVPRALREVDGDFTAVVRVIIPIPNRLPEPRETFAPHAAGGLLAWGSEKDNFTVQLACGRIFATENPEAIMGVHNRAEDTIYTVQRFDKPAGKAVVRLKREGQKVTAGWSRDGKTWKDFKPEEVAWGAKVQVGVVAENNLGKPVEVTFDQYQLTQPKK